MSGHRIAGGTKASGPGSTHRQNAKPLANAGAKASGPGSTHESLRPDRRMSPGAKASHGPQEKRSLVSQAQGVTNLHGTAREQVRPQGRSVAHAHGSEQVSEHHRGAK